MNRRKFLGLSAAATATFAASSLLAQSAGGLSTLPTDLLDKFDQTIASGSPKKGLGRTIKNAAWAKNLRDLRCKWFYSWGNTIPADLPYGVEFIPMIFRYGGNPAGIARAGAAARATGIKDLLGFNEPDVANQGNMTVAEALDAWPLLMETGLRLGSPGCVHPDKEWMIEFMAGVKQRGLRVDFVTVHSYGGPSAPALVKRLETVHRLFERPIWITEFAVGDWQAKSAAENRHRPDRVLRFMEQVLPMLDQLDFVERYAWFTAQPNSAPLGTSALLDENGELTRLGECYRDA